MSNPEREREREIERERFKEHAEKETKNEKRNKLQTGSCSSSAPVSQADEGYFNNQCTDA